MQDRPRLAIAFLLFMTTSLVAVALLIAFQSDALLGLLKRQESFAERTQIWSGLLEMARSRPWLGYGYGAFWCGPKTQRLAVSEHIGIYPFHAHNGLLQLALDLGLVGVLLFAVPLIYYAARLFAFAIKTPLVVRLWPWTYLVFFVLINFTTPELVRPSIYWAVCVSSIVAVTGERRGVPDTND